MLLIITSMCLKRKTFFFTSPGKPFPSAPVLLFPAMSGYFEALAYIFKNVSTPRDDSEGTSWYLALFSSTEGFWANTFPILFLMALSCFGISWVLVWVFKRIYSDHTSQMDNIGEDSEIETSTQRYEDHRSTTQPQEEDRQSATQPQGEGTPPAYESPPGTSFPKLPFRETVLFGFILVGLVMFMGKIILLAYIFYFVIFRGHIWRYSWRTNIDRNVWLVTFALFNLTTAVLWYALVFDGTGTVNPRWTGVFGRSVELPGNIL